MAAALLCLPVFGFAAAPISRVDTSQPVVALTFDDGPHPVNTPRLLALFADEGIKVTFFEIGKNIAPHPELLRAIHAAGHEIGNHSRTHPRLGPMEADAIRSEIADTQAQIKEIIGESPVLFRAPFFDHGAALLAVLDELKLPSITASIVSRDSNKATTSAMILERCTQAGPGDIVLMHTWSEKTMEVLPEIIRQLKAKGLRFVTVSELLAVDR